MRRFFQLTRWKPWLLQFYRLLITCLIVLLIRQHFTQLRIQGEAPIELAEVQVLLPDAAALLLDTGPQAGLFIHNAAGADIGYVVRTSPQAEGIIGYAGPTDVLLVFGPPDLTPNPASQAQPQGEETTEPAELTEPTRKLTGLQIRHSWDTTRHIQWVKDDAYFMEFWQQRDWENLATLDLYEEYMEGVSGATLSSMGIARSIQFRLKTADEQAATTPLLRLSATDYGLWIALAVGLFVTFRSGWKGNKTIWTGLKIGAFVYVGFLNGSLIAIALLTGYAAHGVAWQLAPGLVSLVAIAFFIPWSSRRQPYCNHICPHGAAQQLLSRYSPLKKRQVPKQVAAGLRWLPWLLLVVAIAFLVLRLPLEPAHLEPFDAYLFRQSDWIPIMIAVASLLISAWIPMAYCKYGCPTGALLEFARGHGQADHWGRRDLAALTLLLLTYLLIQQQPRFEQWLAHPAWQGTFF